jgi:hypothetical protein
MGWIYVVFLGWMDIYKLNQYKNKGLGRDVASSLGFENEGVIVIFVFLCFFFFFF